MQELSMVEVDEVGGAESPLVMVGRVFGYVFYKSWNSMGPGMGHEHLYTL